MGSFLAGYFKSRATKKRLQEKDKKLKGEGGKPKGEGAGEEVVEEFEKRNESLTEEQKDLLKDKHSLIAEAQTYLEDNSQEMMVLIGETGEGVLALKEDFRKIDEDPVMK